MKVRMMAPISSGNQPPSASLSWFDDQKAKSTRKKKLVVARHSHRG